MNPVIGSTPFRSGSAKMAAQWYVQVDGEPTGPLSPSQLKQAVDEGRVGRKTLVRLGSDGKWVAAGRVKGLMPPEEATAAEPVGRSPLSAASPGPSNPEKAFMSASAPTKVASDRPKSNSAAAPPTTASEPMRIAKDLGVGAIILGIAGISGGWLPLLGFPLAATGFVLGLVGVLIALLRRGSGVGVSAAGVAVSLAVLIGTTAYLFLQPEEAPRSTRSVAEDEDSHDRQAVGFEAEAEWAQFEPEVEWVSAARPLRRGGVEVEILAAKVDHVELDDLGIERPSDEKVLQIHLVVRNRGSSEMRYEGWSGVSGGLTGNAAVLRGVQGRVLQRYRPPVGGVQVAGQVRSVQSLAPGDEVTDVLVYEMPRVMADEWTLELPADAVGQRPNFYFLVPGEMVESE